MRLPNLLTKLCIKRFGSRDRASEVTRNDPRSGSVEGPLVINAAHGADHARGRSPFTSAGVSSGASSPTRARYAGRGVRQSDFCVGNGRSNKIRTPDNFRLRVISLTCPVDAGLFPLLLLFLLFSPLQPCRSSAYCSYSVDRASADFSFTDAPARTLEVEGRSLF